MEKEKCMQCDQLEFLEHGKRFGKGYFFCDDCIRELLEGD